MIAPQLYDSYTLQALAWRSGHLYLPEKYGWLEIATYQGQHFLSFPPAPTLPMLLLSFFFGAQVPANLVMTFYYLSSFILAYLLVYRLGNDSIQSAFWGILIVCGSSFLDISFYGWVWYLAQGMSLFLTLACAVTLTTKNRFYQGIGLVAFALAVGSRPFQVVYLPIVLYVLYQNNKQAQFHKTLLRIIPLLIIPAAIAVSLGVLNYLRFDSVFEFGHNYLPEFIKESQFGIHYISKHFSKLFASFPTFKNGLMEFSRFDGFAFYLANPIFILLFIRFMRGELPNRFDIALLASITLHFLLLMSHRTFGGWQFGTRYLIDTFPAVLIFCTRRKQSMKVYEELIIAFAVVFNIYGSILFRTIT